MGRFESRDYTSDSARRRATSLPMSLELESYLNVPRISEIEPFPAACAPGTVYVRHFVGWSRQDGASHAALLCRRCAAPRPFLVLRDIATSRVWKFSLTVFRRRRRCRLTTHGTFRVFMIGIQDATKDPPSG